MKFYIVLWLVFITAACTKELPLSILEARKIGVVETSGEQYKSFIHWYDEDLKVVDIQNLKYANLGDTFSEPVYIQDEIYLIPQGLFGEKDTKKAISIHQKDFTITEYSVPNIALQDIAITDEFLFVSSNLNFETHLSRLNRNTNEFTEEVYQGAYFESMLSADNKLFLFGNMQVNSADNIKENYLYILDTDFNMLETIDLTDIGYGAYKFLLDEQNLYVSIPLKMNDRPNSVLLKINVETFEKEVIDLGIDSPDSLKKYKSHLIIAHNDIVTGEGSIVTILDVNTKEKESFDLQQDIFYMDIYQEQLVVANDKIISLYAIDNDFERVREVAIDKKEDTYISSILVIDQ